MWNFVSTKLKLAEIHSRVGSATLTHEAELHVHSETMENHYLPIKTQETTEWNAALQRNSIFLFHEADIKQSNLTALGVKET